MTAIARCACAALAALGLTAAARLADGGEPREVVAQDLKQLRAPGKISAALWTRRNDFYTLQIVLDVRGSRLMQTGQRIIPQASSIPQVQVWLLRGDGTLILPRRTEVPGSGTRELGPRTIALEASYSFPDTAGKEAVAVAMSVDGNFYIEKLEAFGN